MIKDLPTLRNKSYVFKDRSHAGSVLAEMLTAYKNTNAIVLGVPAGGIPVAVVVAQTLNLTIDVAVISKITFPDNTEAGFGAIAFDGTIKLNDDIIAANFLTKAQIKEQIKLTRQKVAHRLELFRQNKPFPSFKDRTIILVDDGIASGFTLLTAVDAFKNNGAASIIIAAPTGHQSSVEFIGQYVNAVYCPNVRSGRSFAVAEAYQDWHDVPEPIALRLLNSLPPK
jgi:putative phosphoribosyl transferase